MGVKYNIRNMKPKGWWLDINHCIEVCKEVKTLKRLQEEYGGCFSAIRRYGFAKECYKYLIVEDCSHKGKPRKNKKPAGWWNSLEHCIEACKECKNPTELHKKHGGCNISIRKHGWQKECYKYFDSVRVRQYTREQLEAIAIKYATHKEFRLNDHGAYASAQVQGILEEICTHMIPMREHKVYDTPTTYESAYNAALMCESRSQFKKEYSREYSWAQRRNLVDELCGHMPKRGSKRKRCIYVAEFLDNHAYIGLTYSTERRWADHMRNPLSSVYKYIIKSGLTPKWKMLTEYIHKDEASEQETFFLNKYKQEGWITLNVAKTGGLGGDTGHSKEEVLKEAAKHETLKSFRENAPGYYQSGYRSDYWDEVRDMCRPLNRGGYSEKELRDIISRFENEADLRKYRHAVIEAAIRMGIWEDATKHFSIKPKERYHRIPRYTETQIEEIAKKYMYKSDFSKNHAGAYNAAKKMRILERVCAHMVSKPTIRRWTEDAVRAEAKKYRYYTEFTRNAPGAVGAAKRYGILKEVCTHMENGRYKYTIEEAKEVAKTYRNRTELFNKDKGAFNLLKAVGLLDELLPIQPAYNFKWTDAARREAAAQCKSRTEFKARFPQAMDITRVNKDWEKIAPHLAQDRRLWTEEEIAKRASHCHSMQELREYDNACWLHVKKHSGKASIARKYFIKS